MSTGRSASCRGDGFDDQEDRTSAGAQGVSDQRYRALFDYAPDGILIASPESRYLDANPSICRMLGYDRDELIGLGASDIVASSEYQRITPALKQISEEQGGYNQQWTFRRKDGSTFAADVIAAAMPDGNLIAMIREATARNAAANAVRTAEERTRYALRNARVGIWDMDYATGVLDWSDEMATQYGMAPGEFGGTFDAFIECVYPDDRAAVLDSMRRAMRTGSDFDILHRAVGRDGQMRWLSGTGRFTLDAAGKAARGVGISQDVSARRLLESQFQQAQKMEAVGRLAGGIAHDFNNLLTVILGFSELLLEGAGADDPRSVEIVEIQKAGMRAAALTRQLLAFSRTQIIEPCILDVNAIVVELQPMLARLLRDDIKIAWLPRTALARIKADRGQLEQVVLNLAVNAQDAMPTGGTMTIETANVRLDDRDVSSQFNIKPGNYVMLTVSDSGVGMSPQILERLFEPFFTTKEVGKGTGLGLASVHGIVTRSGGSVKVQSEVGRGSSFEVYLPEADGEVVQETAVVPQSTKGHETVLVVEDAEALRILTKRLLERQGYRVLVAANAADALTLFDENPAIEVLLTDVVMPGRSGPELSRQLAERRPGFRVIYMSGYTDEAIVQHGVLMPGIAFLNKPFTANALGRKIREVLDNPRRRDSGYFARPATGNGPAAANAADPHRS